MQRLDSEHLRRAGARALFVVGAIAAAQFLVSLAILFLNHRALDGAPLLWLRLGMGIADVAIVLACIVVYRRMVLPAATQSDALLERLRALFDYNADAVMFYDRDGRLHSLNGVAADILGDAEHVAGVPLEEHVVPSERANAALHFTRALLGNACECETILRARDGSAVAAIVTMQPVVVSGVVGGVYIIAKDVSAMRAAEEALGRSEQQFRSIFEYHYDAAAALDLDLRFVRANAPMEKLSAYRGEELIGRPFSQVVAAEDLPLVRERIARVMEGEPLEWEALLARKDGTFCPTRMRAIPMIVENKVGGIFAFVKDVSTEVALERRLMEQDQRVRSLYLVASSQSSDSDRQIDAALALGARSLRMPYGYVARATREGMSIVKNFGDEPEFSLPSEPAITRLFGSPRAVAFDDLPDPVVADATRRPWKRFIGTTVRVDGSPYGILCFADDRQDAEPFTSSDLDFIDLMGTLIGAVLAREARQNELRDLAFHDALTGLANRSLLEEHLSHAVGRARRSGDMLAVHYVDLDQFKPVNDTYGHAAGDEVLREVALRLSKAVREHDIVARLGGDEFVIVQTDIKGEIAVRALSRRIGKVLQQPITLSVGAQVRIGASIGLALFPGEGDDAAALIQAADLDMYRAKEAGRSTIRTIG